MTVAAASNTPREHGRHRGHHQVAGRYGWLAGLGLPARLVTTTGEVHRTGAYGPD